MMGLDIDKEGKKYDRIADLVNDCLGSLKPPENLTVWQAAAKYRKLNNVGSYVGPWDNNITPYLIEPMDVLTSLDYTGMVFAGPARCGKSDMYFNWLTHTLLCDPADMMTVLMTTTVARDWSQGDLHKLFIHNPLLMAKLRKSVNSQNIHDVKFESGNRLLIKYPTKTELSGKTVPRVWFMDYDRMSQDIGGEGSPYHLGKTRTRTYGRRGMTVAESSPGFDITDPDWVQTTPHEAPFTEGILSLYNTGDRRIFYWQCPHCGEWFEPDFDLLHWDDSVKDLIKASETTYMGCPHCGGVLHHEASNGVPGKYELNIKGRWVPDGMKLDSQGNLIGERISRSTIASFWLKGPAASFCSWSTLVYEYLSALKSYEETGSETSLKVTVNTSQGKPYKRMSLKSLVKADTLMGRAEDLGDKEVPEGVRYLIATVDVQKARFDVMVTGFGENNNMWVIDRFNLYKSNRIDDEGDKYTLNPGAYVEDWDVLVDQVLNKEYDLSDSSGRKMGILATGCDSGGGEKATKNAYDFYRKTKDPSYGVNRPGSFLLLKGASTLTAPRTMITYPDSDDKRRNAGARGEVPVLMINPNILKDQAYSMLERSDEGSSYIHFPSWLDVSFYKQLLVETRNEKGKWENPNKKRNESWDLLVYALAVNQSRLIRGERIDWENPPDWADVWDNNMMVSYPDKEKGLIRHIEKRYSLKELGRKLGS